MPSLPVSIATARRLAGGDEELRRGGEGLSRGGPQDRLTFLTRELDRELGRAVEFLATQTPAQPR